MIYPYGLIGVQLKINGSTSKSLVGLEGKIIDENKSLLIVKLNNQKEVKVLKSALKQVSFQKDGNLVTLTGSELQGRPWDRIKG